MGLTFPFSSRMIGNNCANRQSVGEDELGPSLVECWPGVQDLQLPGPHGPDPCDVSRRLETATSRFLGASSKRNREHTRTDSFRFTELYVILHHPPILGDE